MNSKLFLLSLLIFSCQAMEESGTALIAVICKKGFFQTFEGSHMAARFPDYESYDHQELFKKEVREIKA